MDILIIGEPTHLEEAKQKFGAGHQYRSSANRREALRSGPSDVVFDFFSNEDDSNLDSYGAFPELNVFFNVSTISLLKLTRAGLPGFVFGFCGMPTFLNREILEVSLLNENQHDRLRKVCDDLHTVYEVVADRVGLVTPRVICMIINEAYLTVQEGTATREDIDAAMKLGTNYPLGPFEWCEKIGSKNVCRLLEVMYQKTNDGRYRICELLDKQQ